MLTLMSATDFSDLAARMAASVAGVRACLILSRDGLSLGAHPADGEARAREAWDVLQRMGDPQRGFMDMGTEIWVVATGAAYAAVMVATPEVKPGLLLDRMEAQLLAAEESRSLGTDVLEPATTTPKVVDLSTPRVSQHAGIPAPAAIPKAPEAPAVTPAAAERPPHAKPGSVDRVALAREFGRLLDGPGGS
jgi:hypothetical protein